MIPHSENLIGEIDNLSIMLASPDVIRSWSFGEVTKPETINYRSYKPEKDGLFCEKIFGPVKNWECNCGKYKRIRYRGVVCDRCGVEVTHSKVRRERMGHIELAVPVAHIWFYKAMPSKISALLGLSVSSLEKVIYYDSYVVVDPGDTELKKNQLISEEEFVELEDAGKKFLAMMGGPAIKTLLAELNLEELSIDLRSKIKIESSEQRKIDHLKRLRVVEAFRKSTNRAEWMVLDVLPVLPPDLRPLVPLEGGRFATSDLNDLYRRVVNRNNRLKKLIDISAPDVILRNEKRMLQEAVDALFDNTRRTFSVKGEGKRPLKSLSEIIKGKQGRFRQNLLGKRVDYSGRSVIVVGPELKIHQCGLPKIMALELFKPFIIRELERRGMVQTVKGAKRFIEKERPEVWDVLEEVIKDHPVFLNRAPTLHRLGIQSFFPVLVEGKAIRLHPMVCAAFNADFDGDQMAVHVPLSFEAQMESRLLMLASNNILHPASGNPIAAPSQDIVLGCSYLTKPRPGLKGEGKVFGDVYEVHMALANGTVALHAKIKQRVQGKLIETTPGRVLFNEVLPEEVSFVNDTMSKKKLSELVHFIHRRFGNEKTDQVLDSLKELGFKYATAGGTTIGIDDLLVPAEKVKLVTEAQNQVATIQKQHSRGVITDSERYNKIIDVWTHTTNNVASVLYERLAADRDGFNPIFMMSESGARGSKDQIKQLAGMRGLMQKPQKKLTGRETIESPILSNFREGLTVLEYFISTHGARKGLADTALKTADAGYLTRRLVSAAGDLVISMDDCGTILGLDVEALKEGDDIIEPISTRVVGRVSQEDIFDPLTDQLICAANEEIEEEKAKRIEEAGIENVRIRSVLTCEATVGVCMKCYGRNLATGKTVVTGEAVGVMAAQAIGEPGTQLTLRTFHMGGTAGRIAAQSKEEARRDGKVELRNVTSVKRDGEVVVTGRNGELALLDEKDRPVGRYKVPYGSLVRVGDGDKVKKGAVLVEWDPYNSVIVCDKNGKVEFVDIYSDDEAKKNKYKSGTLREEFDEQTGLINQVVVDHRERVLHPRVIITDEGGKKQANYPIPTGAYLQVKDGQSVKAGQTIAKIPHESTKTRDITGGLPRVAELFEARKPKDPAIVSEIDGTVDFGKIERGMRTILVRDEHNETREYPVPVGKHLHVHQGDRVRAGDRLVEGPIDPHDILRISGEKAVQRYLVDEIQQVYKLQGVSISDKHIECIVRQMLQKVRIEEEGETSYIEGEVVDKIALKIENERIVMEGGKPATFKPLLLGITKASLSTESFIAAASFQETTKVLTDAAVQGRVERLRGLKENVIIGGVIPCGTGAMLYRNLKSRDLEANVVSAEGFAPDEFGDEDMQKQSAKETEASV